MDASLDIPLLNSQDIVSISCWPFIGLSDHAIIEARPNIYSHTHHQYFNRLPRSQNLQETGFFAKRHHAEPEDEPGRLFMHFYTDVALS